jgi:hypothetical protein
VSLTVSILARYAWFEHFPLSASLNIGATFTLGFFQIGLTATDLAFTIKRRERSVQHNEDDEFSEEYDVLETIMNGLWFVVYWGNIVTGSIFMQFLKRYWTCGHFSVGSQIKWVVIKLLKISLIMAVLLGVMTMCVMKFVDAENRESLFNAVYTASLIMSNVYGMLILVVLLGHGLIKLPITLWKHPDNKYNLMNALSRADRVRRAYRTSLIEYHE